ncbi:MAG: hypothetical protein Q9160_006404 [Pyrenula sp. 1 TL-2023]
MSISKNSTCPFPGLEKIYLRGTGNLRIDTGLLDSHDDLGINARPTDRVRYQNLVECAPLITDGYTRRFTSANNTGQDNVVEYLYGGIIQDYDTIPSTNVSYRYPLDATELSDQNADFVVNTVLYEGLRPRSDAFYPVPELAMDYDTFIVFISANKINFLTTVDDDIFAAHRFAPPIALPGSDNPKMLEAFYSDQPAGVLGCVVRDRFCNPNKDLCEENTNELEFDTLVSRLKLNERQNTTLWTIIASAYGLASAVSDTVENRAMASLLARNSLRRGLIESLAEDQWKVEVIYWQSIAMAKLQRALLEQFTGPADEAMSKFVQAPATQEQKEACGTQKIISNAHANFNMLGLAITLIIGSIIILLSFSIETIVKIIQRWRKKGLYQRLEWVSNDILQLQRMAFEEAGFGTWVSAAGQIPITAPEEKLATLDISDPEHPSLSREEPGEKSNGTFHEEKVLFLAPDHPKTSSNDSQHNLMSSENSRDGAASSWDLASEPTP